VSLTTIWNASESPGKFQPTERLDNGRDQPTEWLDNGRDQPTEWLGNGRDQRFRV
jgi:hypothetical protein